MKTFQGTIVSLKTAKTAVVEVVSQKIHPLYKKTIQKSKKLKAHYEREKISLGNTVIILETRPISKTKRFKVIKVLT